MSLRGEAQRAAIRCVLDAFGEDVREFVFVGCSTLGLYALDAIVEERDPAIAVSAARHPSPHYA